VKGECGGEEELELASEEVAGGVGRGKEC